MTLLVDTSVWSLAFRRDSDSPSPQVAALQAALDGGEAIVTTGLILQELLQGFWVRARARILCNGLQRSHCLCLIGAIILMRQNCATIVGVPGSSSVPLTRCWRSFASDTS